METARAEVTRLLVEDSSPTTPSIARKCILPVPRKDALKRIYRQLRRDESGHIFYSTKSAIKYVDASDPRICSTAEVRAKGGVIYDGGVIKIHHKDV
jgi:hypothetical protein